MTKLTNRMPNECECGKPTNGKVRCPDCTCWTCVFGDVYANIDRSDTLLICTLEEPEEQDDNCFLAPIVNDFDNSLCLGYRRKK